MVLLEGSCKLLSLIYFVINLVTSVLDAYGCSSFIKDASDSDRRVGLENPFFSLAMRKKLCNKIIKKYKKIYLKHYENKLKSTKSIALVRYLKKKSNYKIFFIIGSDNLINFHKWKNYKELLKLCNLVVFSRKGFDTKAKKSVIIKHLKSKNIKFLKNMKIDISSTQLRKKIINGSK